jgi:hypothetical protein
LSLRTRSTTSSADAARRTRRADRASRPRVGIAVAVAFTLPLVGAAGWLDGPSFGDASSIGDRTEAQAPTIAPVAGPDPSEVVPRGTALAAPAPAPAPDPDPEPEPEPAREPTAAPEPYPDREPQTTCEVVDHVGVDRFRDVVLAAFPWTGDGGIVRDCHTGGASEHKEGRAWDWMLDAHDPDDAAAADEMLGWLLAEDADGAPHAVARRLGVLYVIWDGRIWSAARPEQGWQPYTGASPHTDHVHLSFSSEGARGETSFFADVWDPEVGAEYPATVPVEDDVLALATPTTG